MPDRYPIPATDVRVETVVVNSRFLCSVAEARTVDEAQAFIRRVKAELADASSHACAYHIGFGASVTDGCNDGGEPGGTAGKPMLAILQGSGLGGLVRAFGGALKAALEQMPRTERVERKTFLLDLPYPFYEQVKRLAQAHNGTIDAEEFGASILLTLTFIVDDVDAVQYALTELSAGQLKLMAADE